MAETLRERLERRKAQMKNERNSFIPHYREITDFISPRTARYLTTVTSKGTKTFGSIINNTATLSMRTFKSGMMAGASSPARPWFRLTVQERYMKSAAVKAWLYEVETAMRDVFTKSNFYNSLPLVYGALGGYGTGCQLIEEDYEEVIRCYPFPVGSYMIALNEKNQVDTWCREFPMTVRNLVSMFGIENVSTSVKNMYDTGNYESTVEVVHFIEPNKDRDVTKLNAKDKPFRSVYYEVSSQEKQFLRESGYDEFPLQCPRWDVEAEDIYGYSPAMQALGDVKQLQLEEKRKAELIDKSARPPMLADSTLRMSGASIVPGGVTYIDNLAAQQHASFRPAYEVNNAGIQHLSNDIQAIEYRIKRAFYEDLMLMFANSDASNVTAREVDERHQEKLLILGPFLERMNDELYDKAIDRTFAIMMRQGKIPEPPQEIQGEDIRIEYTSIMAQAQKLIGTNSVERVVGFVGNLMSLGFADAADKLNVSNTIDEYANMHGTPPTMLRSEDELEAIRQQKAQAEQAQQMAAMAPALNQAATAAKTLSDTPVGETSALARMLGA
jgi:hypothetical protein